MATFTLQANPARVVANNTSEHEAVFDPSVFGVYPTKVNVLVTTGTFNFNTKGVGANGAPVTTTTGIVREITLQPSMGMKLFFKATSTNDAFTIWF